jgi:alditol oxidase
MATEAVGSNWSGNYAYRAGRLHHPRTLEELQTLVARTPNLRALGSRHSFTDIPDADALVALDRMPGELEFDHAGQTVSVPGHITYAELAQALNREGRALHSMASLPHISVAGAVATGTHGSGDGKGNLATAVRGLELVAASGELIAVDVADDRLAGLVVGLGALGIVTRVTLATEPLYEMHQRVFTGMAWATLLERFDEVFAAGDSVSVFHLCGERTEQVWVKRRQDGDQLGDDDLAALLDATEADVPMHPVLGGDPVNCTEQQGVPGVWSERLPHFRSGFTPSSGEELQSEFFVDLRDAVPAIEAIRALAEPIVPLLLISELRTIAADDLWLSPHQGRDTLALHFTWQRRPAEVQAVVARIEAALAPLHARPHWGKVFTAQAADLAPLYPRMADFRRLRDELDPGGRFVNDWLRRRVLDVG